MDVDQETRANAIRLAAITKAVRMLESARAQFKVIAESGEEFGDLEAVKPSRPRNNFKQTGYLEIVRAMKPGDIVELTPPTPELLSRFEGAVASCASKAFGLKNSQITMVDGKVVLLCLDRDPELYCEGQGELEL